ncbi:mannosyl-N-acetyl-alpha-D-glucosaminyl-diphospho-ditrans,octacis-undecaprenol 3-alpha-mannosyltransferase / alpha-1,3-rhamnosyltransferase [Thermoflexales bacterium]|nr:mannosyl-N-acetyl-alpha-D-glucosaminyl-diphospho-ditrans,octacis-undecaprenol 3-alpha-mannosyltransferase / alpha-1,3-rhamnosyltransferase [Thermoflexales bacterium]
MSTTPWRVCIDVSAAVHRRAGLGRYAQELVKGLVDLSPPDRAPGKAPGIFEDAVSEQEALPPQLTVFYHQRGKAQLDPPIDRLPRLTTSLSVRPWRLTTALAYFTNVGMDRMFGDIDLFHATEHLLPRLKKTRSVFTLHDLIFQFDPDSHKPLNIAFLKTLIPRFLRAAAAIIAVSECSKRDAVNLYGIPADKIHVIYEGVDPRFKPITDPIRLAHVRAKYRLPQRFILHVGTIEPRKNLPLLFEVAAQTQEHIVVAGKLGWLTEPILAKVKELGVEDRVTFTGFILDDDLPALISAATVLAMPSKYEGFGLPILEALACGTPVVASNAASLPEVGGNAVLYAWHDDVCSWINLLTLALNDTELRGWLRERGLRQAAKFRWETMARETLEVYQQFRQPSL